MTDKQKILFDFCRENKSITKQKAVELIGYHYFRNAEKYVGEILSRMVKSGHLIRVKNGYFEIGNRMKKQNPVPENQLELF